MAATWCSSEETLPWLDLRHPPPQPHPHLPPAPVKGFFRNIFLLFNDWGIVEGRPCINQILAFKLQD